jgi:hypothetical protein
MSKIMRTMFAEARAAREALSCGHGQRTREAGAARAHAPGRARFKVGCWTVPTPDPVATARSTMDWWARRMSCPA